MPETAVRTDETAAPVAPETAARTEPSRESSRPVYTEFERLVMRERDELREAVLRERNDANEAWQQVGLRDRTIADAKAVIRDLNASIRAQSPIALAERQACRAIVDLCVVSRQQAERWREPEPETLRDLSALARFYSEEATRDTARARVLDYLTETYADDEPDEETGLVWLTGFSGGVMTMLEDTSRALHSWLEFPDGGRQDPNSNMFCLSCAMWPDYTERNNERIGMISDPEPHHWPGWLESVQDAVCRVIPAEVAALLAVADEAGREIARRQDEARDEYETACAAWADAKRVS